MVAGARGVLRRIRSPERPCFPSRSHGLAVGRMLPVACALAFAAAGAGSARPALATVPGDTLYASFGDFGGLITIDPNDGSIAFLRESIALRGLAFDAAGRLFAIGCVPDLSIPRACIAPSEFELIELDPVSGATLNTVGPVTDASGSSLLITALSFQPGTQVLYGYGERPGDSLPALWKIDASTAAATPLTSGVSVRCSTSSVSCGLAFAPDGTLYYLARSGVARSFFPDQDDELMVLDPDTGALVASVAPDWLFPVPLAVRSDAVVFSHSPARLWRPPGTFRPPVIIPPYLVTIDPLTGAVSIVSDGVTEFAWDLAFSPVVVVSVEVDIAPGNDRNPINPKSRGVIAVAILGSDRFDVADVDVTTLAFGPARAPLAHRNGPHRKDANHDRFEDLLAHFRTEEAGIAFGDTKACATGELLDGTAFEGCASIGSGGTQHTCRGGSGVVVPADRMGPACITPRR